MASPEWELLENNKAVKQLKNGWYQFKCATCGESINAKTKSSLIAKIRAHARRVGYQHKLVRR